MSQRSGTNQDEDIRPDTESDEAVLRDLLAWGKLLSALVQVLDPFYQVDDLLQTDHPLTDSDKPLGTIVRCFGKGTEGAAFLTWWTGGDASLPFFDSEEGLQELLPLGLAHRWRAAELQVAAADSFVHFDGQWCIERDRLRPSEGASEAPFSKPLEDPDWQHVLSRLPSERRERERALGPKLDDAIERVRSYFAPLESPLFGMDTELLAHHVRETIPREGPTENVTPIVPLFGKGHLHKAFPSTAHLPAHLRVILHRLVRSQDNEDLVTSLLSTLEAVDFSIRFAIGLGQGTLAELTDSDFAGDFNPTTFQLTEDLAQVIEQVPGYRDDARAQAILHLLFQGGNLHPFLQWGGFKGKPRLLEWMRESEDVIRQDNPARAAVLLSEMMEVFNSWVSELTLLCSSWDLVTHVRQDGYLQISLGRGDTWLSCKPLIDPTRYSVWLDRSELTLVNSGGSLSGFRDAQDPVESLDERIFACDGDPPFLAEQLTTLARAHEQGQVLPLGRALFFGLEYLVRLHASLAGGFLRHFYEEAALLDPVLKEGGSLEHTIFFLSYSQRIMKHLEREEAHSLRQVFFDDDRPREFCKWLGLDGGVPGPLQGLLGWSLSLMRPDAKTRLDEVRGQVERLSSLFADFLEESRRLWSVAKLKTDAKGEGAEAIVLTFPTGLTFRGVPDVMVGPRLERGRRSVVVVGEGVGAEEFSDWEGEDFTLQGDPASESEESIEEPSWPSFFDEPDQEGEVWASSTMDSLARVCQARSFSGPDGRPASIAQEVADVVSRQSDEAASVLFCQGPPGTGKTFLCRTLANPECSPLPKDYPVLYLRVDRFPRTRLATVVERLNDHIASEQSLEKFEWVSVPLKSLKSLGTEVARLADDLSALGVSSELLANRLASFLRHLKKVNHGRNFLLILDGFAEVPRSIIPSTLPPGVHILITGTDFGPLEFPSYPYMEYRTWDLGGDQRETFAQQFSEIPLEESEIQRAFEQCGGSLFLARVYADLRTQDDSYTPSHDVLNDLMSVAQSSFSEPGQFQTFLRLLAVLGLYDRPVPLKSLQTRISDGKLIFRALDLFPSLFAFWDEPAPSLGLGHRSILEIVRETSSVVEQVALELAEGFLAAPRRGELLAALSWFEESGTTDALTDQFFSDDSTLELWREELSHLQEESFFFHRVALLDAVAEPLEKAVQSGAGHLREELAWVYNARGLSLLELGLVEEAVPDFERAISLFSGQFASGDLHMLHAMASAHSRMSEAALQSHDQDTAAESSQRALQLLAERDLSEDAGEHQFAELRCRVLLQSARSHLARNQHDEVLLDLSKAIPDLEQVDPDRARRLRGECFLVAAQAMTAQGENGQAVDQADAAVELLLAGSTAELGLQALILRGQLYQRLSQRLEANRDFQRALSILRYHVAVGRLDLEPLLAYTAAQASLVSDADSGAEAENLSEFIEWALRRIRYEGRSDLRGLLAFLLLTRGAKWKETGDYSQAAIDLRGATEQYDLLSREVKGDRDQPVWTALCQSFRNLTALYLSLDEPHLALICGRRALELGRRGDVERDSAEESLELPVQALAGPTSANREEESPELSEVRLFQLGKLYFHLGEAAGRVGLSQDGATYFERAARAFAQACSLFDEIPEVLVAEYALVLKFAAQAAFEEGNAHALEAWVDELASLPDGHLSEFDQYRFWRWSGHTLQNHSKFGEAQNHFERALAALKPLSEHPRWRSLEAEILLDLGRVLSLRGHHEEALRRLEQASQKAHDALFAEGEENRDLLVLSSLHAAVAHLRSGRTNVALEQIRILVSLRPGSELHEVEVLAQDWSRAWQATEPLAPMELLKCLGQLSELGDWLLRTSLGRWYRELAVALINDAEFESIIMSSTRIDRILETYLILTFSRVEQDTRPELNPELDKLLAAKFRAFDSENRDIEAELLMGHLLPIRMTPEAGRLLLRRSEMALLRGDRGLAIIDLLRAIDGGVECRLRAHLRLAEFLQSRGLQAAAIHHLRRAMQATAPGTEELSSLCGRFSRLLTRFGKAGSRLDLDFYLEYFRVLGCLEEKQLKPPLEVAWLKPAREQREWSKLLDVTLDLLLPWQRGGHDKPADWAFLEEVLDRTVLCQGRLQPDLLEKLGQLLAATLSTYDVQNRLSASAIWERFATFLPGLGKRNALDLLQRLFEYALRTDPASKEGHAEEFLRRLEEEKRILVQPR
jgi:tetratricopeptide (TPR) repeat protein